MTQTIFEKRRLSYFEAQGAEMTARTVEDRDGRPIYVLERGDGKPVVFLHGGGADASNWATLIPRMPASWRCIVPDRPGCGLTYKLDYRGVDKRRSVVEYVEDLFDGLNLERASVVGNSMGGYFALAFALTHPERVEQLVVVGAPGGLFRNAPVLLRLMATPGINWLIERLVGEPTAEMVRDKIYAPLMVVHPERFPNEAYEISAEASKIPGAGLAWRTLLQTTTGFRGVHKRFVIRDEVAELPVRTLFVWGADDAIAPPSVGEDVVKQMPDAKLAIVDDAGHLPWCDQLDTCASLISGFVE